MSQPESKGQYDHLQSIPTPPDNSVGIAWESISATPASKGDPPPTEVTPTFVFDALRNGALGGFMLGTCASIAFDLPYWETALTSAFVGSMACVLLSTGVALLSHSRSLFASLVRLMYGLMTTAFIAAFLGVIVLYLYVKVVAPKPAGNFEVPRAKIN
ncbi:MAG: hypothetical protein ACKVP0_15325 [Pirellulaceae bacterium]